MARLCLLRLVSYRIAGLRDYIVYSKDQDARRCIIPDAAARPVVVAAAFKGVAESKRIAGCHAGGHT